MPRYFSRFNSIGLSEGVTGIDKTFSKYLEAYNIRLLTNVQVEQASYEAIIKFGDDQIAEALQKSKSEAFGSVLGGLAKAK